MASAQSFDHFAETYDRFGDYVTPRLAAYLRGTFPLPADGGRAADLGCGAGHFSRVLAEHYREVLAVDISGPMLDLARAKRARPNIDYQQRDLREVTPDRDGQFDLVFSAFTLHHVDDMPAALRQIRRLVAPGGHAFVIDNVASRPTMPRWWFHVFALRELVRDVLGRRRPVGDAWELYRLWTYPAWLDHLTTDRFLSQEQFTARYRDAFPGAEVGRIMKLACGMHWHNTQQDHRHR